MLTAADDPSVVHGTAESWAVVERKNDHPNITAHQLEFQVRIGESLLLSGINISDADMGDGTKLSFQSFDTWHDYLGYNLATGCSRELLGWTVADCKSYAEQQGHPGFTYGLSSTGGAQACCFKSEDVDLILMNLVADLNVNVYIFQPGGYFVRTTTSALGMYTALMPTGPADIYFTKALRNTRNLSIVVNDNIQVGGAADIYLPALNVVTIWRFEVDWISTAPVDLDAHAFDAWNCHSEGGPSPRSVSPVRRNNDGLKYMNMRKTSVDAMAFDLMCLVDDWNVQVPSVACCSSHATLLHARKVLKRLEKGPCSKHALIEPTGMQCMRCGRLDYDMDASDMDIDCPVCGCFQFWPCGEYADPRTNSSGVGSSSDPSNRSEERVGHQESLDSLGSPLPSYSTPWPPPGSSQRDIQEFWYPDPPRHRAEKPCTVAISQEMDMLWSGSLQARLRFWAKEIQGAVQVRQAEGLDKVVLGASRLVERSQMALELFRSKTGVNKVPDVAIRTLERDIRGLQLALPGGRASRRRLDT
eukprot:g25618.t1